MNDGNVLINVSIHADSSFWDSGSAPLNTSYFQYNISDAGEGVSWASVAPGWTNISDVSTWALGSLNYSDTADSFSVYLKLSVPADEPAGSKSTNVVFIAAAA